MEKIYDRDEYIEKYRLDIDEIALLPTDIRLAYIDKIYRSCVEKAESSEEEVTFRGYLHPIYFPYFEACGCRATNYDFGIEEYGIKSVRKSNYKPDGKMVYLALDYTMKVAEIRSEVFESVYEGILERTRESLESGHLEGTPDLSRIENILTSPLYNGLISNEASEEIAKRVINALDIKHKETVSMSNHLSVVYRNVLSKEGYELTSGEELKVRRLK